MRKEKGLGELIKQTGMQTIKLTATSLLSGASLFTMDIAFAFCVAARFTPLIQCIPLRFNIFSFSIIHFDTGYPEEDISWEHSLPSTAQWLQGWASITKMASHSLSLFLSLSHSHTLVQNLQTANVEDAANQTPKVAGRPLFPLFPLPL